MELNQPSNRIHPLMAAAAVSVMLVSLVGIAAITGFLPKSHAAATETAQIASPTIAPAQQLTAAPAGLVETPVHKAAQSRHRIQHVSDSNQQYAQALPYQQPAPVYQQSAPAYQQPAPAYQQPTPVYQQTAPVTQYSPLGIGIGAVVGGLLGSQVGGGKGKTLAAIAGAMGGGYAGNEIAKRYP